MAVLRLGIVGLGRAAGLMIPALAAHPNVRLAAAADPNPAAGERFAAEFGGATFGDCDALCASGLVDAVYIATPHQRHAPDAIAAARHGKHAIVEKPMALSLEDCHRMTEAAKAAGTVLIVGHTHAFDAPTMLMGKLIRSGAYGRVRQVVSLVYTNFLYRPRRPEELDPEQGGGILFNQVPHQLEIVQTLISAPLRTVHAVAGVWDPNRPVDGALSAMLTYADGAVAQLTYSGYDHFDADELTGWIGEGGEEKRSDRHGSARRALRDVRDPEAERRLRVASGYGASGAITGTNIRHEPHFGFLLASCEGADLRPSADGVLIYDDSGVREERVPAPRIYPNKDAVIDELYRAVVEGAPAVHTGEWATRTMAQAFALIRSAREGREVVVDGQTVLA